MAKADEVKLIAEIQAGNIKSFTELVERYKSKAYTIALNIVKNKEDAQEIAQDAFIKVYKNIHSFRQESKFSTWLYRIIYNTAISKMRSEKNVPVSIDDIKESQILDTENQLTHFSNEEQQKFIKQAFNYLKGDEAALLTLYYLEENSIEEIADITGLTTSNIKVKLFRARKNMSHFMQLLFKNEMKIILT